MKKFVYIALLLLFSLKLEAQNYPPAWVKYANESYFFDIESGKNSQSIDEVRFKNDLINIARINLSKQIQVKVSEMSSLTKNVLDGHSKIQYASQSNFTTDLDLHLAETRSEYDPVSETFFAIVFINKMEACNYYKNELQRLIGKVNNAIDVADNQIRNGFKSKAKEELQNVLPTFEQMEEPLFWLNVLGMPSFQIQQYVSQLNSSEQTVKDKIAYLEYGITYYVLCEADCFGKDYPNLQNEVKGQLSRLGCSFVNEPKDADFVINISASAREYNKLSNSSGSVYFIYVDAIIVIDKNATGQRVYKDETSIKGSHTLSYEEAARDGYKNASKEIGRIMKEIIEM